MLDLIQESLDEDCALTLGIQNIAIAADTPANEALRLDYYLTS